MVYPLLFSLPSCNFSDSYMQQEKDKVVILKFNINSGVLFSSFVIPLWSTENYYGEGISNCPFIKSMASLLARFGNTIIYFVSEDISFSISYIMGLILKFLSMRNF